MDVDEVVQEYVLGRIDVRELPEVATQLLLSGVDTLEMATAAMPDTSDPREIRELFETALSSAELTLPTWEDAATAWLRRQAKAACSGQATLNDVARRVCNTFGWPGDADGLPTPYRDVVITAGHDDDGPRWRDALLTTLQTLDRPT